MRYCILTFFLSLSTVLPVRAQWIPQSIPPSIQMILTMDVTAGGKGIGGGWTLGQTFNGRGIFSSDAGKTWIDAVVPDSTRAMVSMMFVDRDTAYCAGARNTATRSGTDLPVRQAGLRAHSCLSGTGGDARATAGTIWPSGPVRHAGLVWQRRLTGQTPPDGYTGLFLRSGDGGKHWYPQGTLPDSVDYLLGLARTATTTFFVTASLASSTRSAAILRSYDSGLTWTDLSIPDSILELRPIQFVGCLVGFAGGAASRTGGSQGVLLRTSDGGDTWTPSFLPAIDLVTTLAFTSDSHGFVAGNSSMGQPAVFYTSDGGNTWNDRAIPGQPMLIEALRFTTDGMVGYAIGTRLLEDSLGTHDQPWIARTTNSGLTWVPTESQTDTIGGVMVCGDVLSETEAFAGGGLFSGQAVLLHTTNGGVTSVSEPAPSRPEKIGLVGNYPNPFNGETRIGYRIQGTGGRLSADGRCGMAIFNQLGAMVATFENLDRGPGEHWITFDARGLCSGVYYARLTVGSLSSTRPLLLLR